MTSKRRYKKSTKRRSKKSRKKYNRRLDGRFSGKGESIDSEHIKGIHAVFKKKSRFKSLKIDKKTQSKINEKMLKILVSWINEVIISSALPR